MSAALIYILQSLMTLALFVVLLRLLLQWARADFRNPICQAIVRLTNPLIVPLRRILPPIGKVDTASVVAVILVAIVEVVILTSLAGATLDPLFVLRAAALEIAHAVLWLYFYAIFLYALISIVAPGGYTPLHSLLTALCEPVLRPIRRVIPPLGGIDLSPLWACILIQAILILLR
jgi:YggT family protein